MRKEAGRRRQGRRMPFFFPTYRALFLLLMLAFLIPLTLLLFQDPDTVYDIGSELDFGLEKDYQFREKFKFFIIGTWKGGTTSLLKYLLQHPNLCPAVHETNFFHDKHEFSRGLRYFRRTYFNHCTYEPDEVYGMKAAGYLFYTHTALKTRRSFPNAKVIVMLRNPIDRVYSHWYMEQCKDRFHKPFDRFLKETVQQKVGQYYLYLRKWLQVYPSNRTLIIRSEEFFANTRQVVERVQDFIGVPRHNFTDKELRVFGSSPVCARKVGPRPEMDPDLRRKLQQYYQAPNERLEEMTGMKFGWS